MIYTLAKRIIKYGYQGRPSTVLCSWSHIWNILTSCYKVYLTVGSKVLETRSKIAHIL